jgi:hypothetical protein
VTHYNPFYTNLITGPDGSEALTWRSVPKVGDPGITEKNITSAATAHAFVHLAVRRSGGVWHDLAVTDETTSRRLSKTLSFSCKGSCPGAFDGSGNLLVSYNGSSRKDFERPPLSFLVGVGKDGTLKRGRVPASFGPVVKVVSSGPGQFRIYSQSYADSADDAGTIRQADISLADLRLRNVKELERSVVTWQLIPSTSGDIFLFNRDIGHDSFASELLFTGSGGNRIVGLPRSAGVAQALQLTGGTAPRYNPFVQRAVISGNQLYTLVARSDYGPEDRRSLAGESVLVMSEPLTP